MSLSFKEDEFTKQKKSDQHKKLFQEQNKKTKVNHKIKYKKEYIKNLSNLKI